MFVKTYLYITVSHLVLIEIALSQVVNLFPDWALTIQYFNYAYLLIVGLHGISFFYDKFMPVWAKIEKLASVVK